MSRCTCGEVRGEDPKCVKHGRDTPWGREWAHMDGSASPEDRAASLQLLRARSALTGAGNEKMKRLGSEFERIWDENVDKLYEA